MIAFDLQCNNGHTFEGWFEDSQAYEQQQQQGLVTCPVCNDCAITKMPSTFGIKSNQMNVAKPAQNLEQLSQMGQQLAEYVEKNFDNVGCDFAKEALKIHYGAGEPRNIRGVSTAEEEKVLKKEGIQFFKFPLPPTSDNEPGTES